MPPRLPLSSLAVRHSAPRPQLRLSTELRQALRQQHRCYATDSTIVSHPPPKQGIWERSKQLAREHGRIYTGVYFGLSALEFSAVFALILLLGADQVRQAEDWALEHLDWRRTDDEGGKSEGEGGLRGKVGDWAQRHRPAKKQVVAAKVEGEDDDASSKKGEYRSELWTSALLAYGIHKVLLFPLRIGATIGITPWLVRCVCRFAPGTWVLMTARAGRYALEGGRWEGLRRRLSVMQEDQLDPSSLLLALFLDRLQPLDCSHTLFVRKLPCSHESPSPPRAAGRPLSTSHVERSLKTFTVGGCVPKKE